MNRAKRLDKIPPYLFGEISRLKAKAIAEGKDLIDLGIGDPDQPTPQPIIDKLCEAANDPETHRYDETEAGWPSFLEAVARRYKRRFNVDIDPKSEAMLLIGSKDGLAHICWAMIDPGDVSLVPDPGYTVYKVNTMMAGGEPFAMPLLEKNGFMPDLTAIPTDKAKAAKLMFLNYPNNPTGAVATLDFYADAVRFAKEYDIAIVSDTAYSDVCYDGYKAPSMLQVEGAKDVVIELDSLSKAYNMTGWRIAYAVGNAELVGHLNKMKSNVDSRQFPAVDIAAAYALDNVSNQATYDLYTKRRDILCDGLNSIGWKVKKPVASLYVWAKVPEGYTSADFAKKLLTDAGVLVIPGNGYGQYGEGYVRMSLTVGGDKDGDRLAEAVERIKASGIKF
ncbi:MAG: LL-diaminopimelate aminotransferase [Abditibacteriota bacterium]|nr:LL-diaminopimelate aminotransferase [Abditibacteriota bacterium]MBP5718864.1 LL-diaminopimelate aminotransferase [Abditibacteriota bacterium]